MEVAPSAVGRCLPETAAAFRLVGAVLSSPLAGRAATARLFVAFLAGVLATFFLVPFLETRLEAFFLA
jgi:hypothetical protein